MFFRINKDVIKLAEETAKGMIENNISKTRFKVYNTPITMGLIRADSMDEESKVTTCSADEAGNCYLNIHE